MHNTKQAAENLIAGIREARENPGTKVKVKLFGEGLAPARIQEASTLTGSGTGIGGAAEFTAVGRALRPSNPLRLFADQEAVEGKSDVQFTARVGDGGAASAWGYIVDSDVGAVNLSTANWFQPVQSISFDFPIRLSFLDDVPTFMETEMADLIEEVGTYEGVGMMINNDLATTQTATGVSPAVAGLGGFLATYPIPNTTGFVAGQGVTVAGNNNTARNGFWRIVSVTTNTNVVVFYPTDPGPGSGGTTTLTVGGASGGAQGLRGLDTYPGTPSAGNRTTAAFGTTGTGPNNGRHTLATQATAAAGALTYDDIVNTQDLLPFQYWYKPGTAWMAHPSVIAQLRKIKTTTGLPVFLEIGDMDAAPVGFMLGHPVIPNANMSFGTGRFPLYLAHWPDFVHIVDHGEVEIEHLRETVPGTCVMYVEKRVASTVFIPQAGVRLLTL